MAFNRRKFIEGGAFLGASTLTLGASSAAAASALKDNMAKQAQQRRTVAIGTRDQQFLLSKITVSNLVRSYRFYTEVIGLSMASPQMTPPTDADPEQDFREFPFNFTASLADPFFVIVKRRGVTPTPEQAAKTIIGFKVPNSRAVLERAAAAGYTAGRRDPADGPMSFAFISDPDGYQIELIMAPNAPAQ
jgi:catechol 2,3-dioxygenase-like lactoylglutathione lyase family enzyme